MTHYLARVTNAYLFPPLVLWGLALLLVPPGGDFPLNDDWIYAQAVGQWIDTGHYGGHPFATASLVSQAGWGGLFCLLFGFSFEALRWSTLVLWAVAASTTGLMARSLGAGRWSSALAGCLVIANPLAFNLGYTFMTDVPFMAMMALAGYGYLRALGEARIRWLLFGSLFGACALLTRQFAPFILVAFLLACLPHWRLWRRHVTLLPVLMLLGPWCVAAGILYGLPNHGTALGYVWNPEHLGETLFQQLYGAAKFYVVSLVYLALFVMPLLIGAAWAWYREPCGCWKRRLLWSLPVFAVLTIVASLTPPHRLPYLGNILYDGGLGPMTLGSRLVEGDLGTPAAWGSVWWIPTILGLLGATWLVVALPGWIRRPGGTGQDDSKRKRRQQLFLGIWALLMILALYHPGIPVRFDRYLLGAFIPVVLLMAGVLGWVGVGLRVVQAFTLLLIFGFSLAAQHDYLAWNRVRWQALDRLLESGVPPERIDGGYEFNGWYTSPHFIEALGSNAFLYSGKKGWWVVDDDFVIAWQERPGYGVRETLPYAAWLGRDQALLVLERE